MTLTPEQRNAALEYAERRYIAGSNDDVLLCDPGGGYAQVEPAENGVWVLAQVWVPNSEIDREDQDDDE